MLPWAPTFSSVLKVRLVDVAKTQSNRPYGFTLTELVVVIVLLSIIASITIPRLFSSTVFSDRGTLEEFESALSSSRNRAITSQCVVEMRIDSTGWSVWRDDDCDSDTSPPPCSSSSPLNFTVPVNDPVNGGSLAGSLSLTTGGAVERLYFTPQGLLYHDNIDPSTGCQSLLNSPVDAGTPVPNLSPTATLRLYGLTGYASLQ